MLVVTLFLCSWKSTSLADIRIVWYKDLILSLKTKVLANSLPPFDGGIFRLAIR